MDVLPLATDRFVPLSRAPGIAAPVAGSLRRRSARLGRLARIDPEGAGGAQAARSRRRLLLAYTAAEIALGVGLLAWVTSVVPILPAIDPGFSGTALDGPMGGLLLWTMFGLLGSVRTLPSRGGEAHFTFHLPYIGAAMVLGGPTAGAWVAFLSTIERRELETQPWYGILANHASLTVAAVLGGTAVALTRIALFDATGDPGLANFAAIVTGALVLEVTASLFSAVTIMLRDQLSRTGVVAIMLGQFGRETALEIALIWAFAVAYHTVGWWAPLAMGTLVIAFRAAPVPEPPDPLTGLMRKQEFERQLARKVGWIRRGILPGGTLLYVDLDRFKEANDQHGHDVGDEVLKVVADRLGQACPRREDLVSRLMGDEFALFYAGLDDPAVATSRAEAVLDALCRPVATSVGPIHLRASIGMVVVDGLGGTTPSPATLLRWADKAMYTAKREAGPCGALHLYSPDDCGPFDDRWMDSAR